MPPEPGMPVIVKMAARLDEILQRNKEKKGT